MLANEKLNRLETRLGYQFSNQKLLTCALTHRSLKNNNERLEFLGDAILGMLIAEKLYRDHPFFKEGQLTQKRSSLVCQSSLVKIAKQFALDDFLIIGMSSKEVGVLDSVLSDCVEALIAAIYLDSNLSTCQEVVLKWFSSLLLEQKLDTNSKDSKMLLQERLQKYKQELPIYQLEDIFGPAHEQLFVASCSSNALQAYTVFASGKTKRIAEQLAAKELFKLLEQKDVL